jgi:hypothetical protein
VARVHARYVSVRRVYDVIMLLDAAVFVWRQA